MSAIDHLGTYLNDHLAGASAGVEMARQLEDAVRGTPYASALGPIAKDIEEDLETLRGLVDEMGVGQNPVKQAVGWVAEKAHRVGIHERMAGSRDLSLLLQAESVGLGVEGKLALWLALMEVVPAHPHLATVDLPSLAERARDQRRRVEIARLGAARATFTSDD
jgi:hypothetical protein